MQYIVGDYYATGEGRCISILITMATPKPDDIETPGSFTDDPYGMTVYVPAVLKEHHTPKVIAAKEFIERFGMHYARGAENVDKDIFWEKYKAYVPEYIKHMLDDVSGAPPAFNYYCEIYVNYS